MMRQISVVMATYNGQQYVAEQIESVLNQTFGDFDLIICDDCSTDGTANILHEYEQRDSRVHVYINEVNMGFKRNFEHAIDMCGETPYVALCDQDDVWTTDHLQHLMDVIGDKALACANSTITDENLHPTGLTLAEQQAFGYVSPDDMMKTATILLWRNPYQGSTMLVRRELLRLALPFPAGVNFHDTWLAILACFAGGLAYSRKPISLYRMHGSNASGDKMRPMVRGKAFRARLLGLKAGDRVPMLQGIAERIMHPAPVQVAHLRRMNEYFRHDTFVQKVRNACYLIRHYRSVFTK